MESQILSSLSNSTRLRLLICLAEGGKNVTQLIGKCGLSQSAVSQHLEKLRRAGLVVTQKSGKEVYYSLKHSKTAQISNEILDFVQEVQV